MIHYEKLGIFLSKPLALVVVFIYLLQSGVAVYLVSEKYSLEQQIVFQQGRITELEEKLQVFKAIDDFQIGFNDEEVMSLTEVIYSESKRYQYDPLFILAIILTESSFKKGQKSHVGARGLMQVVPFVGKDLATRTEVDWQGSETLFEPVANIKLGTLHLFEQVLKFGDIKRALAAYNMGETRLRGIMRQDKPIPQVYINKVLRYYEMLKETYRV
ncbi:MAG: transglycosylase SLT domain-containing protein [candidate division Zixibacteria bacterium]|nr:transglycosylase SLT domain-containing protein [candidate division Zixibacteria bacterium]